MNTYAPTMIDDAPDRHLPSENPSGTTDPRWTRPALAALLVATAAFWMVGLSRNGWANAFYSAAVQAGTKSWKAFLFGSSDAANSITVDKPPASLWPMEISARIFGVNTWSVQIPQVLLGVASVALLYVIVKRQFDPVAGLIAGLVLAVTPVATLMFRYNNPDALLTFLMIVAVWAMMHAVSDGRTRWLVLCGALIGFGFLTKQLQVMLVVPALALTYLVAGRVSWPKRVGQLLVALGAMVAAAGWWVLLVSLIPADQRPYVGGSTDNSFLNLTFGYNGLSRLTGGHGPMGAPGPAGVAMSAGPGPLQANAGLARMFNGAAGSQISWLLPTALLFLVVGILLCGRASRTDQKRAQYLVWGIWLIGTAAVFSFMSGIFHDYYTVALAPAVAALVGIGVVDLWSRRQSVWIGLALSGAVALTAAWSWILLGRSPDFLPWLRWVILVAGVLAALALTVPIVLPAMTPHYRGLTPLVAAIAAAAALAGPLAYSIQTLLTTHTGGIITAGPAVNGAARGFPGNPPSASGMTAPTGAPANAVPEGGPPGIPGMELTTVNDRIALILLNDPGRYTWVAATNGATSAAAFQLATDHPVMPLGGFSSGDPAPTLEQFQGYVAQNRIHYYIEGGRGPMSGRDGAGPASIGKPTEASKIADWVKGNYTATTVDGVTLYDLTTPGR